MLSQAEARCSRIPTLRTALGLKGHRPLVGTLDGHDLGYVVGALNLVTGRRTTHRVETVRAHAQPKQRSWQAGFARHRREIARAYPAPPYPRVVRGIDNAPWHRGAPVTQALRALPHLECYRWPSYRPQRQLIERCWKVWRRRATPNRLVRALTQLKRAVRDRLCYDQPLQHRVLSFIQSPRKRTHLSAA